MTMPESLPGSRPSQPMTGLGGQSPKPLHGLIGKLRSVRLIKLDGFQIVVAILLAVFAVFMLLPLVYIINHAFKPVNELYLYPPTFFVKHPTLLNYKELLLNQEGLPLSRFLFNSIVATGMSVFAIVLVSAMAAYGFSKLTFPGNRAIFAFIIIALMFAPESVAIPRYLIVSNLHIMDTYFAHILPYVAAPISVFLMKQFVDQIPNELIDAAKIDGAREWLVFLRIIMPVCKPAVATIAILAFQTSWAQTESSVFYMNNEAIKTLPYYIQTLTTASVTVFGKGIAAAGALLVLLPSIVIFLALQRKILLTMASSGIK